ncbi:MAG: hypothetical protein KDC12_14080 [Flavobacteriales bacterium]|nr:hypothetical protein [Flavobacteriales bacterium]
MKRLILLALICAPMFMAAQGRDTGASKPQADVSTVDYSGNRAIYAEVVVTTGQGVASARLEFGTDYKEIITNKEDVVKLEALKAKRYGSAIDALNALNSMGFKVVTSFTVDTRQGTEAHIILEKPNLPAGGVKPGRVGRDGK